MVSLIVGGVLLLCSLLSFMTRNKFKEPQYSKHFPTWYSKIQDKLWILFLVLGLINIALVFAK